MSFNRRGRGSPETDINILLLGQTGVGKTTFVNAFLNCLFYNTLDDALEGELKVLISAAFTVTDSETFQSTKILVGTPNDNENYETDGESSTQLCRSYIFPIGNRSIRLIDGPGVGDTRGVDHEARNFEHILSYISNYEHLNGICILFKPEVTRLDIYFRYCIKELLRHLHVNAKDNIMFVFTNSRATFYRPGETTRLLKVLLKELHENNGVEVPFNIHNTFMFDNESFRFLAVCKQGLNFVMKEKKNYSESWNKSVEEFSRLIIRILQCDLHAVKDMQSLNEAQLLIHKLSRPVAEIVTLIQENILLAKQYKEKLLNNSTNQVSNKIPQKTGKFVPLRERLTVCVSEKCTEIINVNGEQRIDYKSNCHVGCSLHRVVQECIGHPIIKRCRALKQTGSCRKCGCHWTKHMHITYQYERNLTYIEIDNSNSLQTPKSIMTIIDKRISDLRNEETSIRRICVKLSLFLKQNSITPFNDDIIEYLQHFINEEKKKKSTGIDNTDVIKGLEKMIKDYTEEFQLFNSSISSQNNLTSTDEFDNASKIDEIFNLVQKLYDLPINGKLIEEQVKRMKEGHAQAANSDEQFVDLPSSYDSPDILNNLKEIVNPINGKLQEFISAWFTFFDKDRFEEKTIIIGTPNESEKKSPVGKSCTRERQSFVFRINNRMLRLIDASGICDTDGVLQDEKNFEDILDYISQFDYLNGICILIKSNEERLHILFRFYIKELLRHLHVHVKENIMFIFTNARATSFQSGPSASFFRTLLQSLKDQSITEVPFSKENSFLFDNEAFRFLALCKHGIEFNLEKKSKDYSRSWDYSIREFSHLISRIIQCDKHATRDTLSLNEAQQLIRKLSRPIDEIATLTQENLQLAEQH
ncbi:unnamed protein product [Rotaria sp. Silwood1]|nr:unnamed protein product [Rotaria sp. Silwood1]CAF4788196.1 unnamed protein product [Rotaria sp. Silwood1]